MKLITYSNKPLAGFYDFIESAKAAGFGCPVILGEGDKYTGHLQKLKAVYKYLLTAPDDIYLFVDAHDSLIVSHIGYIAELVEEHLKVGTVFMSAEKACNPYPIYHRIYPDSECDSSFRYLNSGGWIAYKKDILNILEDINVMRYADDINDQGILSSYFLSNKGKIVLDTNCHLFQCLYLVTNEIDYNNCGRIYNSETGTYPAIIHGNGRSDLSKALTYLKG